MNEAIRVNLRQVLSNYKETHYFISGVSLGFLVGFLLSKVI